MSLLRPPAVENRYSKDDLPPYGSSQLGATHAPALSTGAAMRLGAVFSSINYLADTISTLPIDTYRTDPRDRKGSAELIDSPAVIAEPAPDVDVISWRRQVVVSWLSQGNLFADPIALDDRMRPRLLQIIDPAEMTARRPTGHYGSITWRLRGKDMPNMVHRPAYTLPGQQIGLSPLGLMAAAVGLGLSAQEFGRRWFVDGAHPSSVFTSDKVLDSKVSRKIKKRVMAAMRGNREPLILGAGITYQAISVPANESQFLETSQANKADVASWFGLKATDIGGKNEDSMTYANVEQRGLDRLVYPVNPWVIRFEHFLNSLCGPGIYNKFNLDALVRPDLRTRTDVHLKTIQSGMSNVDERRAIEDQPPLPDGQGDRYVWPPMSTKPQQDEAAAAETIQQQVDEAGLDINTMTAAELVAHLGGA